MKLVYLLFICFSILLNSCTPNVKYYNRPEDITEGTAKIKVFFKLLSLKNFEKLNALESDSLKVIAGKDGAEKWAIQNNISYGKFLNYVIIDHATEYIEGNTPQITYVFKIQATYTKKIVSEDIGLEKINNAEIKLISVNTDN